MISADPVLFVQSLYPNRVELTADYVDHKVYNLVSCRQIFFGGILQAAIGMRLIYTASVQLPVALAVLALGVAIAVLAYHFLSIPQKKSWDRVLEQLTLPMKVDLLRRGNPSLELVNQIFTPAEKLQTQIEKLLTPKEVLEILSPEEKMKALARGYISFLDVKTILGLDETIDLFQNCPQTLFDRLETNVVEVWHMLFIRAIKDAALQEQLGNYPYPFGSKVELIKKLPIEHKKFVLQRDLLDENDIKDYFTLDEKYQLYQEGIFLSEVLCRLISSKELEIAYGNMAFSRQFAKAAMPPAVQARYLEKSENRLQSSLDEKIKLYIDGYLSLEILYDRCSLPEIMRIAVESLIGTANLYNMLGPKLLPLQTHRCTTIQELFSLQEEELCFFLPDLLNLSEEETKQLYTPQDLESLLQANIAPSFLQFFFLKWLPAKERERKIEEAKANLSIFTRKLSYTATLEKKIVTDEFMKRVLLEYLVNFTQIPHPEDGNAGTA